jgi:hypothetical protein
VNPSAGIQTDQQQGHVSLSPDALRPKPLAELLQQLMIQAKVVHLRLLDMGFLPIPIVSRPQDNLLFFVNDQSDRWLEAL